MSARALWDSVAEAAWHSADPGVQYDTTINDWHTCPQSGRINASNPCSEYMFLDDTACNLASLNLMRFRQADGTIDVAAFEHATRLWTVVLEISVMMAQYPSRTIAELSYRYRTLGLGYANLGALLMSTGLGYDSAGGRAIAGAVTALMTGTAYATSAEMAGWMGAFPGYADNRDAMLRVIRNHRRAAHSETAGYEGLAIRPQPLDAANCPDAPLVEAAKRAWDKALALGEQHGFRNAQVSVIAPTGTIGLVMDCDTTGIEPDFALVKFKKLAGGGYFKIINRTVPLALETLGYDAGGHRAHRRPRRRPWLARRSARDQSRDAGGARLRPWQRSSVWKSRSRPPSTSASPSRATPWAKPSAATCWVSTTKRSPIPSSTCCRASDSPRAMSPRRTFMRAGR